ncbi:TetR/AcrR family transcriptional regulator [Actinocorallia sp. A-T 12471]|uniref:TetR/AcrR family transcriptional regulator n=1 Tax=Actinocorallia sp. A-T 12471 TaxID=3089813 RepID=UPI0029CDAFEA|nr:TetR family transcriptional regulator [Actinocorallia sp. A-T 12471]MDX6743352.1 TetR family transcriptional regulator [Actinocorallia sp. A-T 12471]
MNDARERILGATLRLVVEHGVAAVTNRLVAAEAGVSLGTLTYHFAAQGDLLHAALTRFVDVEIERISALALSFAGAALTPREAAEEVERAIVALAGTREQIAALELHLQAARDPALQDAAARSVAAYDALAAAILDALGVPDPTTHAPVVVSLLYGLAIRRLSTGDPSAKGTATALTTLLTGITSPLNPLTP